MARVRKKAASKKKTATRKNTSVVASAPQELSILEPDTQNDNVIEISKYLRNLDEVDEGLKDLAHSIESRKKTLRATEITANKELLLVLSRRAEINLEVIAKLSAPNARLPEGGGSNVNVNLANINFEDPNAAAQYYANILSGGGAK